MPKNKQIQLLLKLAFSVGQRISERVTLIYVINFFLLAFQFLYLISRYKYINELVPLWYTKPWGDFQLGAKSELFLLPVSSALILLASIFFLLVLRRYYVRYFMELTTAFATVCNVFIAYSLVRIILISSVITEPLINPLYVEITIPAVFTFLAVLLAAPHFIDYLKKRNIVTNPQIHDHPGMLLSKPSARSGSVLVVGAFLLGALIFVPAVKEYIGIYIIAAVLALVGFIDDYQNTHPNSSFRFFEVPLIRLLILFAVVSAVTFFSINISFIGSPFGGIIDFTALNFNVFGVTLTPLPAIITVVWIVWVINVLSWSNGIDGQYAGIISIAAVVVALLALRFMPIEAMHLNNAKLSMLLAGAGLGLLPYTWHPSRIMWGFGAISVGFILSALSILVNSKIAISVIIILIPFLDAMVTVIRRLLQKKNPLKGDRGHLHHLLLERGWGVKKIAIFYWLGTAFFGLVALFSSEKWLLQTFLMSAGAVAFFIILLNLRSIAKKQLSPTAE